MGDRFAAWIGRQEEITDIVAPDAARGLVATIASRDVAPVPGEPAPLLTHWLRFLPIVPLDRVGADGHPRRGDFLPDVDLPRRMWAGSSLRFERPVGIGTTMTLRSTIAGVAEKDGRSGRLVFVSVDHEIFDDQGLALAESQDIVYRDVPQPGAAPPAAQPAPADPHWTRRIDPDPVLLFRYSALTFNGHRVHYDRPYAMAEEGYPGLVVHGPMIATLLLHELLARHPGADVAAFRFRAVRPIFDIAPFFVCGSLSADGIAHLFARDETGALCMDATATLRAA